MRGVHCTYCADVTTLAFVDGTLAADGIRFDVNHVNADGSTAYKDTAVARFDRGRLIVTGTSGASGGSRFERVLIEAARRRGRVVGIRRGSAEAALHHQEGR